MIDRTLGVPNLRSRECANQVERVLNGIPGVFGRVAFAEGVVRVAAQESIPDSELIAALRKAGFQAHRVDTEEPGPLRVVVIGGGPAATAAAVQAADSGAEVTVVERNDLGGTCINVGAVPSKLRLRAAETAFRPGKPAFDGISATVPEVDLGALIDQEKQLAQSLGDCKFRQVLEDHPRIRWLRGSARLQGRKLVTTETSEGSEELHADRILLAVGAAPYVPPIDGLAATPFWTSVDALETQVIPEHLVVLGGGYVGVEMAQAFQRLGSRVTLITRRGLLADMEPELGERLAAILAEEGMALRLHTTIHSVSYQDGFSLETRTGEILRGDRLLVAAGREPNTDGLGLEGAGVPTDRDGFIHVNERLQTDAEGIYAVGDCTDQNPRLVYVAAAAGARAATNMTGGFAELELSLAPQVVFTDPQVASVGLTEREAREQDLDVEVRVLPLSQVPRAVINRDARGVVKLVAERGGGRLLGAHLVAEGAGEVIQTACLGLRYGISVAELAGGIVPFLTMAEGLKLCAQRFSQELSRMPFCVD
ncbi:mercury(II) reductase [Thiohalorhabdus methylotrophus]|uniref:Mercuric reductase n=1 Tax=Thiohalorhabdus methylotrophus TaxID=3242694 RepID=A0ABV4TSR0_9GAMM